MMPRPIATLCRKPAIILAGLSLIAACETASSLGDEAIRTASFGRVQATPFTDAVETRDCRESLSDTLGFTRETRAMKNGVFVVQAFDCEADRVVAKVSLTNYTSDPMYCFAQTEDAISGVRLAPNATGFFEYSYRRSADQDCELTG